MAEAVQSPPRMSPDIPHRLGAHTPDVANVAEVVEHGQAQVGVNCHKPGEVNEAVEVVEEYD